VAIFSERLKFLRGYGNLQQKDIARFLNISSVTYYRYENNKREPSMSILMALADYFDVSIDYLVGRSDNPNKSPSEDVDTFLARLRALRKSQNITQEDISKILNIGMTSYYHYEHGRREPSMSTLIALADYFDVSIDYLVGCSDNPSIEEIPEILVLHRNFNNMSEFDRAKAMKVLKDSFGDFNWDV